MQSSSYRLELDAVSLREQLLNVVRSRREASERYHNYFRTKLPEYYDLWRGFYTGNWAPTKNNVWIPLIYSTIWSDVARKIATAFSQWPIVTFSGYGSDDMPIARKQEALINAQLSDAGVISKELNTFLCADLYGTAVTQLFWDHQEETRTVSEFVTSPIDGSQERVRSQKGIINFDGPNYRNVDLLDFYPQPGYRDINGTHGMQWCCVRYYLDLNECRELAKQGIFDGSEVERMVSDDAMIPTRVDEATQRRFEARLGVNPSKYTTDKYTRPVEIIEMWGRVPGEFAGYFDGSTNVVLSMANDKYLFRAMDNPYEHRQLPFVKYSPTPDPHYFYAPGKAEVAHQLQIAGNRFVNHQLDAADYLVHPMWIYDRNKGVNTRNLVARPGGLFGVDGSPGDALMPVPMDFRTLQAGGQMTGLMWQMIQMGSGVAEDTVMGLNSAGADRQTAREFLGRREASGTRLMLESVLYDQVYLEPLANQFCSMNIQFLDVPRHVLILGDAAMNDPVTGEPIEDTRMMIDGETLNMQYAARAAGSTMALSRETEKANMLTMFQVLAGAQPYLAGSFNMVNFLRQFLRTMGFKNVNEIIQQAAPQGMPGMEGMGGVGEMPGDAQGLMALMGGGMPSGPQSGVPQMEGMF